jgi:DNA-binding transcriptional LysR family regulator
MHLKTIRVFCEVVQQRSFSRAADHSGISQSAASQMVHQLEQRLGVKLIDRSTRPFVLTPEGKVYYTGCRNLVESYQSLEEKVRSLHEEVAGRVRVASIYSIGLHHMNGYLQRFMELYPKANVQLEYLHPSRVYRSIQRDTSDLGLVSYARGTRLIEAVPWREEPMVAVCSARHEWASLAQIELEMFQDCQMISFDRGLMIRHEIDRTLQKYGVEVNVAMEFDNIETIKRAIEIGAGVGILPERTLRREVAADTLAAIPIKDTPLVRPIGIIHRRGKDLGSTARHFVDLLKSQPDGAGGDGSKRGREDKHDASPAAA